MVPGGALDPKGPLERAAIRTPLVQIVRSAGRTSWHYEIADKAMNKSRPGQFADRIFGTQLPVQLAA